MSYICAMSKAQTGVSVPHAPRANVAQTLLSVLLNSAEMLLKPCELSR